MKVLIAGSSGFIGTALCKAFATTNTPVYHLSRTNSSSSDTRSIPWNPTEGKLDPKSIEYFDVVINLAGESISGRWTNAKKKAILDSRLAATSLLAKTLALLQHPPKVFLNASAIGYYGNRADEILTETSPPGNDFLADVCKQWESATEPAAKNGIRTVLLRTGIVLSTQGGALKKMLLPFKLALGGNLGSGTQYMSWITMEDLVGAIFHLIQDKRCHGPFNLTCPDPVPNATFTKTLGGILNRPTFFSQPPWLIKLILGEMGEKLLLASTRATPKKLLENGYLFLYPELNEALRHLLSEQN
jgi:uncharacterized protein